MRILRVLPCFVFLLIFISTACSFSIVGKVLDKLNSVKDSKDVKKENKISKFKGPSVKNSSHSVHGFIPTQIKCEYSRRDSSGHPPTQCIASTFFFCSPPNKVTSFQKCEPCPKTAKCVPAIQCPAHLRMSKLPQLCDLPGKGNTHGLCCTTKQSHTTKDFFKKHSKMRASSNKLVDIVAHDAKMEFKMAMHKEKNHLPRARSRDNGITEPDFFHQMVFGSVSGNLKLFFANRKIF